MSTMFTVKAENQPEVASDEAHGDHLPFLDTSSPLHTQCKLPNYTGKELEGKKGRERKSGGRGRTGGETEGALREARNGCLSKRCWA